MAIILGTRPEIIKMSPVIRVCEEQNLDYFILHTGQHYSYEMDRVFFEELELPQAKYNLNVGSGTHAEQTGKILIGVERILEKEEPDVVLVEGDTNTVLAGALAATKLHINPFRVFGDVGGAHDAGARAEPVMGQRPIKVGHVEAGLRNYDRRCIES